MYGAITYDTFTLDIVIKRKTIYAYTEHTVSTYSQVMGSWLAQHREASGNA